MSLDNGINNIKKRLFMVFSDHQDSNTRNYLKKINKFCGFKGKWSIEMLMEEIKLLISGKREFERREGWKLFPLFGEKRVSGFASNDRKQWCFQQILLSIYEVIGWDLVEKMKRLVTEKYQFE